MVMVCLPVGVYLCCSYYIYINYDVLWCVVNGFELHRCSFPSNEYNEIYVSHFKNFPLMVYLYVAHDYHGLRRKMVKYKNMLPKHSFHTFHSPGHSIYNIKMMNKSLPVFLHVSRIRSHWSMGSLLFLFCVK